MSAEQVVGVAVLIVGLGVLGLSVGGLARGLLLVWQARSGLEDDDIVRPPFPPQACPRCGAEGKGEAWGEKDANGDVQILVEMPVCGHRFRF